MRLTRTLLNQGPPMVKLKTPRRLYNGHNQDLVNSFRISLSDDHGFTPLVVVTFPSSFPLNDLLSDLSTRVIRMVPLLEQTLLTVLKHLSASSEFSMVRVSLLVCVVFCGSLFVFMSFFFWPLHLSFYGYHLYIFKLFL